MGKSKNNKFKNKAKSTPTGLPSVKDMEQLEAELIIDPSNVRATGHTTLQNILEELQTGNEEAKVMALVGLSCLTEVELDKNAVKIIAPMLVDLSTSVQLAAANALRTLVLSGGALVADLLIEDDLMTPLIAQLTKQSEELFGGKPKGKDQVKSGIFIAAVQLLWSLCENSETVLPHVNSPEILSMLLAALHSGDNAIAVPAAQCLQTITEDNPKAVTFVSKQQCQLISVLGDSSSVEPDFLYLQCLIAGLVVNIHYGVISRVDPTTTGIILAVLSRCLSMDITTVLSPEDQKQEEAPDSMDQEHDSNPDQDDTQNKQETASKITKKVEHLIDAQICALEILANICSNDGESDDDEGMDTSDGSEDNLSETEGWDEDLTSNFQTLSLPPSLPVEIHEALQSNGLVAKTMDMTQSVAKEILTPLGTLADIEGIHTKLRTRQCRALLSLHNLVRGLTLEELGGVDQLNLAWKKLATTIVKEWHNEAELLEAGTTSLRALTTRLAEEQVGASLVNSVASSDLETFCKLAENCKDSDVKVNVYRVLASLAAIVSANFTPQTEPLLTIAGRFLLDQSCHEDEVWVVAEALDALMDALAEDCSDKICKDLQLVNRLKALVPTLQRKIKANRRSLGSKLAVVTTVKTNLARFIKYKAARP